MYRFISKRKIIVFVVVFMLSATVNTAMADSPMPAYKGTDLKMLLTDLSRSHEEIQSLKKQVDAAKARLTQARGEYLPSLDLSADGGRESIDKEFSSDTTETRYDVSLKASQLITDFGKTTGSIERAGVLVEQAQARLESARQQIFLEGISAYINIVRARERLKSARLSESRIKELTGIEKALVEKGAGLSSDVLQAKSQLAGAMALRTDAMGELNLAKNRFQAVFNRMPTNSEIESFEDITFPFDQLPTALGTAVDIAIKENPELMASRIDIRIAQKDIKVAKSAFFPELSLFAEAATKDNDDGVKGYRHEAAAGVEFKYNLFSGGSDSAALKSAASVKKAAALRNDFTQRLVAEQVANSWEQLSVLRQKAQLLKEQASIVQSFLELAKKERKMGTRSLLDVLNGEINYINATSNAIAARQDTKLAAFNLLHAMGRIKLDLFK